MTAARRDVSGWELCRDGFGARVRHCGRGARGRYSVPRARHPPGPAAPQLRVSLHTLWAPRRAARSPALYAALILILHV